MTTPTVATGSESFGALLLRHRQAASLSQEQLAERAQLSVTAIQALERGRRTTPRPVTVDLLATGLGLNATERANLIAAAIRPRAATPEQHDGAAQGPAALPLPANALLGRERQLAGVVALLKAGERLVTLTGPGGIGKTRLALAVAAECCAMYADGVVFVDLSPLRDYRLVPSTVARAVGVQETSTRDLEEQLVAHLRARQVLLLVDNFEHLLEGAAFIAKLLAACPLLAVLATSRAPLRLRGERRHPVPPLEVPSTDSADLQALTQSAAVALFVERAQEVRPDFVLTQATAAAVAGICRRLDGLPLSIELAARRTHMLPPRVLLAQLSDRLKLLVAGTRDMPARQRTLRATLDWSYELLSAEQQVLLRRLAVFVGGCSLEAVQAVCDPDHGMTLEVLDSLETLVDHSLVRQEGWSEDVARFDMLETVREYARDRLVASGEEPALLRAHAAYFLGLVEQAEPQLNGAQQRIWLDRLDRDYPNVRLALRRSFSDKEGSPTGIRLATALGPFWWRRGRLAEGRSWLMSAVGRAVAPRERLRVLRQLGWVALLVGDYGQAECHLQQSLDLARELGDERHLAATLDALGILARNQGNYLRAIVLYEQSLQHSRRLADRRACAAALNNVGIALRNAGDYRRAREVHQESLELLRGLGDRLGAADAVANLGDLALDEGNYVAAGRLFQNSLAIRRELGDARGVAIALNSLGRVAGVQGDFTAAKALHAESLALAQQLGLRWFVAAGLEGLAVVAAETRRPELAARLLGAAASIRDAMGSVLAPTGLVSVERSTSAARAALGESAFGLAFAEGQAMDPQQAVAYALGSDPRVASNPERGP